jgi:hypothetical protein
MFNYGYFILTVRHWHRERKTGSYNEQLAATLLSEELNELLIASSQLERIDALADIAFVAAGNLIKLSNFGDGDLAKSIHAVTGKDYDYSTITALCELVKHSQINGLTGKQYMEIIALCFTLLYIELKSMDLANKAAMAICKSNNSKSPEPIPEGQKYSKSGKGPNYKSPAEELQAIIEESKNAN